MGRYAPPKEGKMTTRSIVRPLLLGTMFVAIILSVGAAFAADSIKGQVMGGGAPIAKSTVTLWRGRGRSRRLTGDRSRVRKLRTHRGSRRTCRARTSAV